MNKFGTPNTASPTIAKVNYFKIWLQGQQVPIEELSKFELRLMRQLREHPNDSRSVCAFSLGISLGTFETAMSNIQTKWAKFWDESCNSPAILQQHNLDILELYEEWLETNDRKF